MDGLIAYRLRTSDGALAPAIRPKTVASARNPPPMYPPPNTPPVTSPAAYNPWDGIIGEV